MRHLEPHDDMRRAPRRLLFLAGIVACSIMGVGAASALSPSAPAPVRSEGPAEDGTPDGRPVVSATAKGRDAAETTGVVVYKNKAGDRCAAQGVVDGGAVGNRIGGKLKPMPLKDGGTCDAVLDPVSLRVERAFDDPSTDVNEEQSVIWGLAAGNVKTVRIEAEGKDVDLVPERNGAFITVYDQAVQGAVAAEIELTDGSQKRIEFPPFPDAQALSEEAIRGAPSAPHSHSPE